jgi:NADH-quinone oxidoreductase subunit N
VSSNDFLSFYLTLEMQSLALYILVSIKRYSKLAVEAGFKYFTLGALSSAILVFGISLLYGLFVH